MRHQRFTLFRDILDKSLPQMVKVISRGLTTRLPYVSPPFGNLLKILEREGNVVFRVQPMFYCSLLLVWIQLRHKFYQYIIQSFRSFFQNIGHQTSSITRRLNCWPYLKSYFSTLANVIHRHHYVTSCLCMALRWRHNGRDSVSNHQPHDCLLNRLFRRRSKTISKRRVTGLCAGNSPGTGEFPAQMASNVEIVSVWWRHHGTSNVWCLNFLPLRPWCLWKIWSDCEQILLRYTWGSVARVIKTPCHAKLNG